MVRRGYTYVGVENSLICRHYGLAIRDCLLYKWINIVVVSDTFKVIHILAGLSISWRDKFFDLQPWRDAAYLQKQMQIAQKEEAGIQLTQEEFDFMADACACEEIERVNANCTLKDNLQEASTSAAKIEKVNSVNRKMKETNAELTTELARYKNQEKCFEISQEKYDKLERNYKSLWNGNVVTLPAKGNGNGINGNTIRCYNCQREGHYASNSTLKSRKWDAAYLHQQL
nr:hypothetical protein [Tanacetum cinerariifolium]